MKARNGINCLMKSLTISSIFMPKGIREKVKGASMSVIKRNKR